MSASIDFSFGEMLKPSDIFQPVVVAAGFVPGLPDTQRHRQWRLTWLHMVASYRLHCACRACVQQHKQQQVGF